MKCSALCKRDVALSRVKSGSIARSTENSAKKARYYVRTQHSVMGRLAGSEPPEHYYQQSSAFYPPSSYYPASVNGNNTSDPADIYDTAQFQAAQLPEICNLMNKEEKINVAAVPFYSDQLTATSVNPEKDAMSQVDSMAASSFDRSTQFECAFFQPLHPAISSEAITYADYATALAAPPYMYDYPIYATAPSNYSTDLYIPQAQSATPPPIKLEQHSPPPQDPLSKPPAKKRIQAVSCHSNSVCANCGTRDTTLWRRNHLGDIECNACNLYYRKNQRKRPLSLKKDTIMKRNRKPRCDSPTYRN